MSNNAKPGVMDATLIETKAWPAAGATAYSDSIDLKHVSSTLGLTGVPNPRVEFKIELPALANLVATKYAKATMQHSADDSSFTDVETGHYWSQTAGTANGVSAVEGYWKPGADTKRYIRLKLEVEDSGGNNTASSVTMSAVF